MAGITAKNWRSKIRGESGLKNHIANYIWAELKSIVNSDPENFVLPFKSDVKLIVNLCADCLVDYYTNSEDVIIFGLGKVRRSTQIKVKTIEFNGKKEHQDFYYIKLQLKPRINFKRLAVESFKNMKIELNE